MAHLRKHGKKWQAVVRRGNKLIYKSFWKKSDASAWAYKTEAQLETGTYQRVEQAEKLADIKLKEILNISHNKTSHAIFIYQIQRNKNLISLFRVIANYISFP